MKNIYEVLRQKELQLQLLKQEVEALRVAAKLLADEQDQAPRSDREISQPEMIRTVLLESEEPLHVRQIADALHKKYKQRVKPNYVSAIIYRCIKAGKLFYKAEGKAATFGLLEKHLNPQQQHGLKVVAGHN